ncbi:Thymidine kinase [Xylanimonas cellulosilytica DSM 15894]|uniref:Thymidine kinase n=1 Tax=Xylanimonas cellulosilytica (strain DSM 15894 / JCM 12276 / CECT 5975 / KCTC 9989 / LMG 20990 / NBRC 107835 / XIL07) TaxID=446471 RepID=D1BV44_XYLCX|nr:thymidine kinase [Xylanimonas cellulosilytica]ACZ31283.1 Thymidine kinase [Xylanimonas cellulosilytica DSM 15894]
MSTPTAPGPASARTAGRVEVVAGPMFAGKSEELVRRVRRARIAGRGVVVVNHALDVRAGGGKIASHSGLEIPSATASEAAEIPGLVTPGTELVAIDEAQFFGPDLVDVVLRLADDGLVVVVAGLCVTFDGRPFEPLPALMAVAENVVKLTAVCTICGRDAAYHVRLLPDDADATAPVPAHVGGQESYQARCRQHRR